MPTRRRNQKATRNQTPMPTEKVAQRKKYRIKSYVEGRNNGATERQALVVLVVYIETN